MVVGIAFVAGFLAARVVWITLRPVFAAELLQRGNFRGRAVPVGAGVVVPLAVVGVEAVRAVAAAGGLGGGITGERLLVLVLAAGLALLGFVDDVLGGADARGFRGHVTALVRGRLTTGGLKLAGGGLLALIVAAPVSDGSLAALVVGAALVALAANLANLFDRAPGRAGKVALVLFVALVAAARADPVLAAVAVPIGALGALLLDDLHERLMLGDAGANVVGGALGFALVLTTSLWTQLIVLAVVLALNALSEVVSFSRVIASVPPLRALDRLGRLPED